MIKQSADVVIIGAGIQGLSAAYHLAKSGINDVVVVEKEFVSAGSSGRSASMLMLQVWTEWQIKFSQYCFPRFMTFEDEFGVPPDYRRIGTLMLATEAVAEEERKLAELRQSLGVKTEIWTPDEIKQRHPVIFTDDLAFGVYGAEDGGIEAGSIMRGYQHAARQLGVTLEQGVRATGITLDSGRVSAVETTDGSIATRFVVNAAGATAAEVGAWVGLDIPLDNRVRNIYVTDDFPLIPDDTPFVFDTEAEWYYRKEGPGVLMGMGKRKTDHAPMSIDWSYLPDVIDAAVKRVPALADAGIASGWTGIRSLTPDHHPIIGAVDGVEGYINSCGWGGEGVMHSPIGGQLVSEWIRDGEPKTFPAEPFLLKRFAAKTD